MKDKITTILFLIVIFGFGIAHILLPDNELSNTERRKLSTFPKFTLTSEYSEKIDKYLLDHFPLRDTFRSLKAKFNYNVLQKLDNNEIYLKDNYIFKSIYPTNKGSISSFVNKTNKIKSLLTDKNKTYIMVVPDKNYYLDDKNFLQIDYDYLYNEITKLNMTHIDIRDIMTLNDYYETDTHWKQENLDKVVKQMSTIMNFEYKEIEYKYNTYNKFYGVYYGESAISRQSEKLTYLTNDTILNSTVKYLENDKLTTVYNLDNLNSLDPYEVYLDGASAIIEITNNNSKSKKELIIFRDSFGSSLSPLLIEYYGKITIVDNRYIGSDYLKEYIPFKKQDVLFMYSTFMINNSGSIKG